MEDKTVKYIIWALVGIAVIKYVLPSLSGSARVRIGTPTPGPTLGYGQSTTPYQPGAQLPSPYAPGAPAQSGTSTDPTAAIIGAVGGAITGLGNLALGAYNSGVFGGSSGGSYSGDTSGGDTSGVDISGGASGFDDSPGGYVDNSGI